ncbi:MAG: sensor domain-containing diguanylate cyclase [Thermoleophilia bacterium]
MIVATPGDTQDVQLSEVEELKVEQGVLREEIRVARRAAELTAELVVRQFEETDAVLQRLQEVNAQRAAVLEAASEISIIAADLDGHVTLFNRGAEALLGYQALEVVGRLSILDFHLAPELTARTAVVDPDHRGDAEGLALYAEYVSSGRTQGEEWTYVRKDGTDLPVSLSITALRGPEGEVTGYLSAAMDLTPHRQAEQAVRRAVTLMQEAIAYSPVFIWETDPGGHVTFLMGARKVMGYAAEEILGRPFRELRRTDDPAVRELHRQIDAAVAGRQSFEDLLSCLVSKEGSPMWISMSAHPILEADGAFRGYRGVSVDVSELTRANYALEEMALHDQLTGLANRRKLYDRFLIEVARLKRLSSPLSLLVVDVDRFKSVNDRYGHLAGDECLKLLADLFVTTLRESDLVARFGGEEFIVLLPETGREEAVLVAEKLRETVASTDLNLKGAAEPLRLSVCAGIATMHPENILSLDDMIEAADKAAYSAKTAGRNRVVVCESVGRS